MWKLTFSRVTAALSRILPLPIAVAIFVLDMITPREAAFAVLYVGVVLMAARSAAARGIALTAAGCACLTLLAYISDRETLANATLSVVAIAATAFLAIRGRWAEDAVRLTEAEWREIFEHNPVMYFVLNSAGTVLSVNSFGAAELLYVADELIGQSVFQVFLDADRERVRANLNLCLESLGQSNTWEVQKVRKDGGTLWVRETATAIKRANGGVVVLIAGEDITERRRAEESVRESAKRFRALIEHAYDAVLLLDSHNSVLYVSPSVERILGYSAEEMLGRDRFDLFHPDELPDAKEKFEAASRQPGSVYRAERLIRHKSGNWLWIENTVTNLLCEPSVHAFVVNLRDITESKQAGDALRASEERFRSVINHATDSFFLFDEHQAILDVNRQACEGLGYSREEMIGMHPRDFDAGLDAASIARIGERVDGGEIVTFETLHRRKDRTVFPVEVRARQFQQGPYRLRLSLARDITERKHSEKVLRDSEAKLQKAQQIAHFGWWERDFITNRVSLSDEVSQIFGLRPVDLPEWHARWLNLIHPEDRSRTAEATVAALLPGGPRYDVEYRVVRPDGAERIVHSQGDVTWDESGQPTRQFGVLQDITELRQAEEALRVSEARFRTFVDYATDAFFLHDDQLTILDVNQQACVSLGYCREELIGMHPRIFDVGLDEASIEGLRQRVTAGEPLTFETRHRRKDGTVFPVEIRTAKFEQGGRHRHLTLVRDITERKQAEEGLRQRDTKIQRLAEANIVGIYFWDAEGPILDANDEFLRIVGYDRDDLVSGRLSWIEISPPEWRERVPEQLAALKRTRTVAPYERDYIRKDGARVTVLIYDSSFDDTAKQGVCFALDLTERQRAEEALRRSEAYLAEAQRLSHTGTSVFNETETLYWSEECYRVWELDPRQGLPDRETVWQRIYPDDRDRARALAIDALRQRREYVVEFRIVLPDGTVKHLASTGHPVLAADGERVQIVATHIDVTERVHAQEQSEKLRQLEIDLAHLNRLSMMGELTASLAHEILHPIATARNNARAGMRFLDMIPPDLGEVREALDCVVRDADRAKDIVGRIREHVKKAPPRKDRFDLNEAINEVIIMARGAIVRSKVSVQRLSDSQD